MTAPGVMVAPSLEPLPDTTVYAVIDEPYTATAPISDSINQIAARDTNREGRLNTGE